MGSEPGEASRARGWLTLTAGLALVLVGSFLPWLRSGRAWRNSYEIVRTADRLGLVGTGFRSALGAGWYLVPFLCGLTLLGVVFERRRLAYVGSVAIAGLVGVMAVVAWRAPLRSGWGPEVTAFGAVLAVAGSVLAARAHLRRPRGPRRTDGEMLGTVTQTAGRWRRSAR